MRPFDPRLLRVVPEARRPVVVLAGVGVATGAVTIAGAFALAAAVTAAVDERSTGGPLVWLLSSFVARALLAGLGERVAARAGVEVSGGVRRRLIDRWALLPRDRRPDDAIARTLVAQGCSSIEPYAARFLPTLVQAAVVPALAVAALLVVDWLSALIVLVTLPLLPLFAALIGRSTAEDTERRWRSLSRLAGHFLDVMRGLPTLVSYGRGEAQRDTIEQVSQAHRRATMRTLRLAFMSSAALELLATISVALVAVSVGLRLTHDGIALQTGLLAILLAPEAYWPIRRVGAEFHAAADGAAAIDQALPWLEDSVDVAAAPVHEGVELEDIGYTHPGSEVAALRGITAYAGRGLTVITGPSGAGKTTLLEIVAGLRIPSAGRVVAPSAHLVEQRPFLLAGSFGDNLRLGNGAADPELWAALRRVGLDGLVASAGLDARIGDDGVGLSAGQRARLAIARAILADPVLLLLDEPTAHLDEEGTELIDDLIVELAAGRVVLAVSHRDSLVACADQHLQIDSLVAS